jgi:hypothetical protein
MIDFAARMSGCTIFSKVDLRKGLSSDSHACQRYLQNRHYYSIWVVWVFVHGVWFAKCWEHVPIHDGPVASGLPFIFVYLDDIIVGSLDIHMAW